MRLEWIEDLIAICEARSLTEAAVRRNVTQPAFSRRIRAIEDELGVRLIDRTRRPARPLKSLADSVATFRDIAGRLRQLPVDLGNSTRIVIACQHALSVSLAPELVRRILRALPDATVRLRSANREECLALLLTQQADVMVGYETDELPAAPDGRFVEKRRQAQDVLLPVIAPGVAPDLWSASDGRELPAILYPPDVFLGMVMARSVLPRLGGVVRVRPVLETALTLAAHELARSRLGAAWVPASLVQEDLATGRLVELPEEFPRCEMSLVALRLKGPKGEAGDTAWRAFAA